MTPTAFAETSVHFGTPPVMDAVAWKILSGVAELTAASYLNGKHGLGTALATYATLPCAPPPAAPSLTHLARRT